MFAILRGANGRRHEVDFQEEPVVVDIAMSAHTVQITMEADDHSDPAKRRYVTVALPRAAFDAALAAASAASARRISDNTPLRLVTDE